MSRYGTSLNLTVNHTSEIECLVLFKRIVKYVNALAHEAPEKLNVQFL